MFLDTTSDFLNQFLGKDSNLQFHQALQVIMMRIEVWEPQGEGQSRVICWEVIAWATYATATTKHVYNFLMLLL